MFGDYNDKKYFQELAAKAGLENVRWIKKAINSTLFLQDTTRRQKLSRFLSLRIEQSIKQDHPFLPAPSQSQIGRGDYELCKVVTGKGPEYAARIRRQHLPLHGICMGPTGSGKTTVITKIGRDIHCEDVDPSTGERRTAVWFFDTEGHQIPALLARHPDILFIHVRSMFKLNRWKAPAGVPQTVHITKLTVQDREIRYERDFMMLSKRDAAFELLNRQGIFNERQLLDHISSRKCKPGSRDFLTRESLINRLRDPLEFLNSVYDTMRSHDLRALTRRSIVWDLHDLSSDHVAMVVGDLILQLQEMMPVQHEPVARLVLVFDEFSHVCNTQRLQRADLKEPYLLEAVRTFRKRGVCFVIGIQEIFSVPRVILSNIDGFWLVFRPADGYSARIISESLSLNADQIEYALEMPERHVLCKTAACPRPFLGHVGDIHLPVASEEEVAERREQTQKVLDSLLEPEPEAEQLVLFSEKPTAEQMQTLYGYHDLVKPCLDYLEFLARPSHQLLPVTELDQADSFSSYKAHEIREQLEQTGPGLIRLHRISTGRRGGPLSVVEITEAGYHLLGKLGVRCQPPAGHGAIDHVFWQHALHRWALARGYPADIEKWQNGKSVDVGIVWDEKKAAAEVALEDMEKEMNNLVKDLEAGWDQVVFCVLTDKELTRLQNEIAQRFGADLLNKRRVAFQKLSSFLQDAEEGKPATDNRASPGGAQD